jgi:dUTP pyrophosphatase
MFYKKDPMSLTINVKRLDETLPLPEYKTWGSSGLDLYASEDCVLAPGDFKTIPTGIAIEIPAGYEGEVRARSGLASKSGIGVLNSPGTIDSDYRGEIKVILFNFSEESFEVKKGNRIAQLIISRVEKVNLKEVKELTPTEREDGGFGSTDY